MGKKTLSDQQALSANAATRIVHAFALVSRWAALRVQSNQLRMGLYKTQIKTSAVFS